MPAQKSNHWLDRYANDYHPWNLETFGGRTAYKRRLGLVEWSFDTDGVDYGGRADMNALLTLEIRHTLSKEKLRTRIALAWTSLRLQHVLLMSKVIVDENNQRSFVVNLHQSREEAFEETLRSVIWVEDLYPTVDAIELHRHGLNVGRIIDPNSCMSRLHVLPLETLPNGNFKLSFFIVMAHQISDGLSAYNWFGHFIRILNMPASTIEREIDLYRSSEKIASRLPPAQEDLYPKIAGNRARERWYWAVIRVIRHVRKGLPPTFVNPLRRERRLAEAETFSPTFSKLFDYSPEKKPPMNSFHCVASLSKPASNRLIQLCRSVKVSVGAGCFALAGLAMMELEEKRNPNIPDVERLPFAASFPLNPRTFFGWNAPADSCMLAFSSGILMPFLSSSLPIEGRFRLTALHANRELRMYQKRLKSTEQNVSLEKHSPGRLLAEGYLYQIDRVEGKLPPERKTGTNPQGSLPVKPTPGATCGVSSVGSIASFFKPGAYHFDDVESKGKDFVADFRGLKTGVRARDNEFLVGSNSDSNGIVNFGVSYDGNAISEEAAAVWADTIKGLLEADEKPKL